MCLSIAADVARFRCTSEMAAKHLVNPFLPLPTSQANKRIDGMYLYIAPPSLEELEARARGRLKEADSTIDKRLAWAVEQVKQVGSWG